MHLSQRKAEFLRQFAEARYIFCVDFEATCCDRGTVPREEMEIIEFGGVLLDREKNWDAVERVEFFIKPTVHPVLTEFCKTLTNITQEQVDERGLSYSGALNRLEDFHDKYQGDYKWCSWGAFDKNIAVQNGTMKDMHPLLVPETHFNLKVWYSSLNMTKKGFGLDGAINREGLKFLGQHHRALSDAENVAQLFRRLVSKE